MLGHGVLSAVVGFIDWGGGLVEWSFMETQYNPVDGWFGEQSMPLLFPHTWGSGEDTTVALRAGN